MRFLPIGILLLSIFIWSGCSGAQRRAIDEADKQGQVVVLTPEQTDQLRKIIEGQMPKECPTAAGTFWKNTTGKVTMVVRCE